MYIQNPYDQYRKQSILTASQNELTLMLYNGCIKFINKTKLAIEEKDFGLAHEYNMRARAIIEEFMSTLNMEVEIAQKLYMIYEYLLRRLQEANLKKDVAILDEVLRHVTKLRDTWEQVMKQGAGK
ncbi:MAG: flagellar export chaperone FliS [Clostridiaceae bacterium]|nr:flagellar export chaperone FliS [Clostridiaceae bacterium]